MDRIRRTVRRPWQAIDIYGNLQTLWGLLGPIRSSLLLGLALVIASLASDALTRVMSLSPWFAVPFWCGVVLMILGGSVWIIKKIINFKQTIRVGQTSKSEPKTVESPSHRSFTGISIENVGEAYVSRNVILDVTDISEIKSDTTKQVNIEQVMDYPPTISGLQPWMSDRTIMNQSFRITDLPLERDMLRDKIFIRCTIYGPAIIAPLRDVDLDDSDFYGSFEELSWLISQNRETVIGAIGIEHCRFMYCKFFGIGIAGPQYLLDMFRDSFNE